LPSDPILVEANYKIPSLLLLMNNHCRSFVFLLVIASFFSSDKSFLQRTQYCLPKAEDGNGGVFAVAWSCLSCPDQFGPIIFPLEVRT